MGRDTGAQNLGEIARLTPPKRGGEVGELVPEDGGGEKRLDLLNEAGPVEGFIRVRARRRSTATAWETAPSVPSGWVWVTMAVWRAREATVWVSGWAKRATGATRMAAPFPNDPDPLNSVADASCQGTPRSSLPNTSGGLAP